MTNQYDVLISGYGPVGQVAANMLGQRGFRVAVFDIATRIYNLPRAAHFDGEVMRIEHWTNAAEQGIAVRSRVVHGDFVLGHAEALSALGGLFPYHGADAEFDVASGLRWHVQWCATQRAQCDAGRRFHVGMLLILRFGTCLRQRRGGR